ncbi:glycerophosphodiester phosphodiesterase [Methylobacter sp. G7]|uniref:glycerophosphodiester phosphodiesterase n=1 Tax=Methylobacter sp. G7 TaxID=3230117 RepID=UPI003D80645C
MSDQSGCLIFAHRGANREAAENTRAAFNKALQYPIDGIETDVQLSLDQVPVLWHDWELEKLGYPGKCIDDFNFAELEQMDFSGYNSPDALPEGALSLQEFIGSFRGRCGLDIELKNRDGESRQRLETKILQMLAVIGTSAVDGVFVSSYSLPGLIFAHRHAPDVPLYYLLSGHHTQADIERLLTDYSFLAGFCLPIDIHNEAIAKLLHDSGKGVAVYTCNSVEEIQKALDLKANILITDYPQLALQMRDS